MDTTFCGSGREEEEEEEPSYSKKEEEDSEEDDMAYQKLGLMTQVSLTILGVLHKMPRHSENLLKKYDLDKTMKAKYHLDNFYLHMKTLELRYDYVACRLFPCTLDGREVV